MSILRLIGIYLGWYDKQALGYVNLDEIPLGRDLLREGRLDKAYRDTRRALSAEDNEHWRTARFWWSRAASRFTVNQDEFVLYLMCAAKAANKGKDPAGWR